MDRKLLGKINNMLDEKFKAFKLDIDTSIAEIKVSIENAFATRFTAVDKKLADIEKAQQFQSDQYETFRKQIGYVLKSNTDLKAENELLNNKIKDLERKNERQAKSIDDLEQYGRREMIEIFGIPKLQHENCEEIIVKLADKINVHLERSEIEACHRISAKEDAAIIVKLESRKLRERMMAREAKQILRNIKASDIGFEEVSNKIFINESLTKRNKNLLRLAKIKKRDLNFKFVWTKNGSILMRKNESARIIKINFESDLDNLE